ncbi:MAG: acetyl-CoA synthetase, partial [Celeribacter sp.]
MTKTSYSPDEAFTASAHIDRAGYDAMYAASVADPEAFW